jgi:hypothetical protein
MRNVKIVWKISRKKETPANVGLCLLKRKIYISMIGKQDDLQDEINIYLSVKVLFVSFSYLKTEIGERRERAAVFLWTRPVRTGGS